MPEEDRPGRTFLITPKHSNAWLRGQEYRDIRVRREIAEDMLANAREVEGGVDWFYVYDSIRTETQEKFVTGPEALAESRARAVGLLARDLGLNLDAPEVVYLSTYFILWSLKNRLANLHTRIDEIEKGVRIVETSEKEQKIKEVNAEAGRAGAFHKRISESLTAYTDQHLSGKEKYLSVLRTLMFLHRKSTEYDRRPGIIKRLKNGDVDKAYEILVQGGYMRPDIEEGKSI